MSSSELSNNPFINDPSNPHNRFPSINALEGTSNGYSNPGYSNYNPGAYLSPGPPAYQQQQQQQQYGGWSPSPSGSQFTNYGYGGSPRPVTPQYTAAQPSSGFAQYQQPYVNYSSPQVTGGYQGYGTLQPQQQQQPAYLPEFDPYANSGAGSPSGYSARAPASPGFTQGSPARPASGTAGVRTHPREYIRTHKAELELWDVYSWKQVFNAFDALRAAWEGHKEQIDAQLRQGGYYLGPHEAQRLQEMQKEATHNIDSIAASFFQMQEVHSGYRQSGDLASKSRVRESVNAALQGLPDWPQN